MEKLNTDYVSSMKVSQETFEQIKEDYQKLFDSLDADQMKLFKELLEENETRLVIWDFWHKICRDKKRKMLPESTPGKSRVFEFDPEFEMYPDDTNDNSLETALTRAFNSLLVVDVKDVADMLDHHVIYCEPYNDDKHRIDDEEMIRWWEPNEEKYEAIEDEIRDFSIEGNGWELYSWHDVSGWDYWVNQQEECNYIQITVEFEDDQIHRFEIPKIEDAIDTARGHFDQYNNPGEEGYFPS